MTNAPDDEGRGTSDSSLYTGGSSPRSSVSGPASSHRGSRHRKPEKQLPLWQEMLLLLGIALVLAIVIKAFFMQAFYIPSGSMNNTLVLNDRILVEKVSYWGGGWLDPSEVQPPSNPVARVLEVFGLYPTGGHLVKRVIGVGGDEVKCCDAHGRITVNGVPLHEKSYLDPGEKPSLIHFDVHVHPGYLWVMGDNRSNSADSRVHLGDPGGGQVPVSDVVGKVFAVVWPLNHATILHRPATFNAVGH